ncbi:glutamate dehydrogenase [Erythrobacter sp. HI0063]|jgi:glutamate dehydrogenase (NADP+)|uniref:NADP-specific glutamate dehydrogenase n=1 Tax=Erythrobacter sp. HI0063 TaxID=1822240 RepID=UPI0007C2CEB9|nr:NADP-specific glutamate dehydrogenase [Erythrobacter sp. HI0063]KZY57014.1 glutamate dehydrogenase [Erythrobacter sp. HI0063]
MPNTERSDAASDFESFMDELRDRNPGQDEFVQAVGEVARDVFDFVVDKPEYLDAQILRRLTEPDRVVSFRVCWEDDDRRVRVERGWRVQNNNSIGPYKGGLRFHPGVTESVLKFLAFEQTFKNALTGLPLGGGKGGSSFDPKGKSDAEIMRFCQSFMTELYRHIGPHTDVPAGDIGVGSREIGFLFGQYKRIVNRWEGAITGKGLEWGGSELRPEATGFGAVYFLRRMLDHAGHSIEGKSVVLSGAGNVALHAAQKLIDCEAKVLTLSDSDGFIHDPDGIDQDKLDWVMALKQERRGRIKEYVEEYPDAEYHGDGARPWHVDCDIAMPCATQNEIEEDDAKALVKNDVMAVVEGANMPTTHAASCAIRDAGILFAPAKAANAGGVAVSGLEMSQNAERVSWNHEKLDSQLTDLMAEIHDKCAEHGEGEDGKVDYARGANIAAFEKVASAMLAFGVM